MPAILSRNSDDAARASETRNKRRQYRGERESDYEIANKSNEIGRELQRHRCLSLFKQFDAKRAILHRSTALGFGDSCTSRFAIPCKKGVTHRLFVRLDGIQDALPESIELPWAGMLARDAWLALILSPTLRTRV